MRHRAGGASPAPSEQQQRQELLPFLSPSFLPPQASVLLVVPEHDLHVTLFVFFPSGNFLVLPPLSVFSGADFKFTLVKKSTPSTPCAALTVPPHTILPKLFKPF